MVGLASTLVIAALAQELQDDKRRAPPPPVEDVDIGRAAAERPVPRDPGTQTGVPLPGRIELRNDLGRGYRVTDVRVFLDGREIAHRSAPEGGELAGALTLYEGPVLSGSHQLSTRVLVEGRDRGIFRYLDKYKMNLESVHGFLVPVESAGGLTLVVRLDERKGANVPFEKKPMVSIVPQPGAAGR